jgi:hypothetical protein
VLPEGFLELVSNFIEARTKVHNSIINKLPIKQLEIISAHTKKYPYHDTIPLINCGYELHFIPASQLEQFLTQKALLMKNVAKRFTQERLLTDCLSFHIKITQIYCRNPGTNLTLSR